jgi:aminoglycoside 6-adenylyltransferase
MIFTQSEKEEFIPSFLRWAEGQPLVRAALLTSTLAIPGADVDILSDFDVILILSDVRPFFEDWSWLGDFGTVLAKYCDPLESRDGFLKSGNVTQYENGLKIDFTLWPVGLLQKIAAAPALPDELDAGYRVLLDKDQLTRDLTAPTYRGYIPSPPTEAEYLRRIEEFFLDTGYTAKYLWRGDQMAAKTLLDYFVKDEHLRPMLEWHMEIKHQWSLKPGLHGRGLQKWLRGDLWAELGDTYTGFGVEENWQALDRTIALMRKVAQEVGAHLGYAYPAELDRRAVGYVKAVKNLPRSK